jgi:hypothetical protein
MTLRIQNAPIANPLDNRTASVPVSPNGLEFPQIAPLSEEEVALLRLEKFVAGATLDLLGRAATPNEIRAWVSQISSGVSRATLATCLLNSPERREKAIRRYYERFLKRPPTLEILHYWCDMLSAGRSQEEVLAGILSSPEYVAQVGPKNEHYVRALYRDAIGSHPTLDEVDSWVGLLDSGSASKSAVAFQFLSGEDFRRRLVREWYLSYLDREPDRDAVEFSVEQLRLGHSAERVQAQILATKEYFSRALRKG